MKANEMIEELFYIELAQRRLPPRSGLRSIKYLLLSNIFAFSLFIAGGSPHLVSEHFPWQKWEFFLGGDKKRAKLGSDFHIHF